jgi:hypothetical protein
VSRDDWRGDMTYAAMLYDDAVRHGRISPSPQAPQRRARSVCKACSAGSPHDSCKPYLVVVFKGDPTPQFRCRRCDEGVPHPRHRFRRTAQEGGG